LHTGTFKTPHEKGFSSFISITTTAYKYTVIQQCFFSAEALIIDCELYGPCHKPCWI